MVNNHSIGPLTCFIIMLIIESYDCTDHYVSINGIDNGHCGNVSFPCQTLEYIYHHKMKTDDKIMVVNSNCDRYVIHKTILLSNSNTADIRGIQNNGCLPIITTNCGVLLFGVKENSTKIKISVQSLNFLHVGLVKVTGRKLETLQVNITNCYIKGMRNESFLVTNLTYQPSNQTIISIHNSTFISSGMKISGHYFRSKIMVKITDSKFLSYSMIDIVSADTFIFSRCHVKGKMDRFHWNRPKYDRYIVEVNKVNAVKINDLLIEHITCSGVMKLNASYCVIHNVIARYIRAATIIFHLRVEKLNTWGVVVQNVECMSMFEIFERDSQSSMFISNLDVKETKVGFSFLYSVGMNNVSMMDINFQNLSSDGMVLVLTKSSIVFMSKIYMKGTKAEDHFLQTSEVTNVTLTSIKFENASAHNGYGVNLRVLSSVFLSKLVMKDMKVKEFFLMFTKVTNVTFTDMNFEKTSAHYGYGVKFYIVASVHMSKCYIREAYVKKSFLYSYNVKYINLTEIRVTNGRSNRYIELRYSISASLSSVFLDNASSMEEMIIVNSAKNLTISNIEAKKSKTPKFISISSGGIQNQMSKIHTKKNKDGSFHSVKNVAVKEEYSRALTIQHINFSDYSSYLPGFGDIFRRLRIIRAKKLFDETTLSTVSKALLTNITLQNVVCNTFIQTTNTLLSIKQVNITSVEGRAFNFQDGAVEVSDAVITSNEGVRAMNCNLTIGNANFIVSDSAIYFRNSKSGNLNVNIRDVRIIAFDLMKAAIIVRGEKDTNVNILRLDLRSKKAKLEIPLIEIATAAKSIMNYANSTLSCPQNSHPLHNIDENNVFAFEYYCKPCSKGFYTVTDLETNFSLNTIHNSTTIVQHGDLTKSLLIKPSKYLTTSDTTWSIIGSPKTLTCKKCPNGGTCVNVIVSNDNYWGKLNQSSGMVKFYPCSNGYCCSDAAVRCNTYNTCNLHRYGTLCSKCRAGYSVDYFSTNCLPASSCKAPLIFWLLFLLTSLLYILAVGYLDQLKTVPNFLKKIIYSLACLKVFQQEEEEEEVDVENVELKRFNSTNPIDDNSKGDLLPNGITLCQEPDEDKCRWSGIFNVLVVFYQIRQLLIIDLGVKYKSNTFLSDVFNLEIINPLSNVCPSSTLNDLQKQVIKDLGFTLATTVPVLILPLLFHLMYIYKNSKAPQENDMYTSKGNPDKMSLLTRCYACLIRLIAMRYKNMATFTFILLHCVTVGNEDVLYIFTELRCWSYWQYIASSFLWLWIVPFPLSLFLSLKLLKSDHISTERFLLFMGIPTLVPIFYVWKLSRNVASNVCILNKDDNKLKSTISSIFENPYRSGNMYWYSWLLYQRLIVAYLVVFYIDPISRLSLIFPILVLFLLVQLQIKPYKDDLVNQLESISISLLIIFAGVNMLRAFLYVNRGTNDESITSVLKIYNRIDLVLTPLTFLILYLACQLFLKIWKKVRVVLIKRIRKKFI